jgi:hypothetical protein
MGGGTKVGASPKTFLNSVLLFRITLRHCPPPAPVIPPPKLQVLPLLPLSDFGHLSAASQHFITFIYTCVYGLY